MHMTKDMINLYERLDKTIEELDNTGLMNFFKIDGGQVNVNHLQDVSPENIQVTMPANFEYMIVRKNNTYHISGSDFEGDHEQRFDTKEEVVDWIKNRDWYKT